MWGAGRLKVMGACAAAGVVAAAATGYAVADNDQITVCVHRQGGGLYRAAKCAKGDSHLSWAQQGPAGPRGQAGAAGAQGPAGATGAPGTAGSAGTAGTAGTNGTNGVNGAAGPGAASMQLNFAMSATRDSSKSHTIKVGTDVVTATCDNDVSGTPEGFASLSVAHPAGTTDSFSGTEFDPAGNFFWEDIIPGQPSSSNTDELGPGDFFYVSRNSSPSYVSGPNIDSTSTSTPSTIDSQLTVTNSSGTQTYTINETGDATVTSCHMTVVVTPTNGLSATVTS